ncbi:helix-turn-helix domain-containing protein [Janthinobacterium agaricidamnosum]|uniref:helix-turn-helix domain-containing protein n=1 Tax=Janthinobacterium agaricidamnosum TaxID=55508 RepID=UPI00056FD426|nr:helix-turn-helix transcriptional regulator [Janthinobacterium agaricidamnosum]
MTYNPRIDPQILFGQRVVQLRKVLGWSQEKLALESGLARSYVGGIERGQRNIALVNICILAATLGVPPNEMLNFETVSKPEKKSSAPTAEK